MKINTKMITGLNIKGYTINFMEDNTGENLSSLGFGDDVLDKTPTA